MKTITTKVPSYWTQHWKNSGQPTGAWFTGKDTPSISYINDGFFLVFHPEQEIETTMLPCLAERRGGFVQKLHEINLSKYIEIGKRLSLRQRITGVIRRGEDEKENQA